MSDLSATNCGCGCENSASTFGCNRGGISSCLLIIILLFCCGGCGFGSGRSDDCGNNSCLWIILILLFCCNGNNNWDCGCGC
ncbi:chorion class high-cysteine HCB protein 13 [bacterium]|uniref:chorion class high-cysteine HCB protein 13 n=1 Tax=Lachnospiraceae TaxID=186803 RepID=UPI002A2EB92A|nr:chorion class high-cysteine HCB protein 13 [bacterium]MDY2886033.1 chorion class high-cysteine HCB protein 13 [Bariatricus sp.]MCI7150427.1 chorion class high-cysteine HCB protein 13 [bacterium]MDD6515771.1 chorion class high-cysteine HCB protein 13 [bacterium]MDD7142339.1 chorion class high-cysteine HCB protein 13 [bacterium]